MAKYIPAWQRTVRVALENTPWETLSPQEQQSVQAFVTEKNKGDENRGRELLTQLVPQVRPRRAMPLGVIILLWVQALAAAPMLSLAVGTKWLAPALALCIVWEICTCKKDRMRKLWQDRDPGAEGVSAALTAMYRTTLRSPVKASGVKLAVMAAALVLLAATWFLPENAPAQAEILADRAGEIAAGKATLAEVLPEIPAGQEGLDALRKATKFTAYGSDEEFLLTALMLLHRQNDPQLMFISYDDGLFGRDVPNALRQTAPGQVDNPEEIAALEVLLRAAGPTIRAEVLPRFVQQKQLPEGMLAVFGKAMKDDGELSALLAHCGVISAAGHDPTAFLQAALTGMTLAGASDMAVSAAGADRALLLRAMGANFTDLDEVLEYLRLAKALNVAAGEVYPHGAEITLDTSRWDPVTSPRATSLGKRDTFLVLRRTEKPEPFTTFVVPEEEETGPNEELPGDLYADYDPDAETGMSQYTVVLETAVLDKMPPERIPQTLADCDAVVLLDTLYVTDGYTRFSRGVNKDGAWVRRQIDSPTFAAWQLIDVYNAGSGQGLFSYKENWLHSPAMLEENLGSKDALEWNPADHYIAAPDDAWMAEAYADFLHALERRGWLLVP